MFRLRLEGWKAGRLDSRPEGAPGGGGGWLDGWTAGRLDGLKGWKGWRGGRLKDWSRAAPSGHPSTRAVGPRLRTRPSGLETPGWRAGMAAGRLEARGLVVWMGSRLEVVHQSCGLFVEKARSCGRVVGKADRAWQTPRAGGVSEAGLAGWIRPAG